MKARFPLLALLALAAASAGWLYLRGYGAGWSIAGPVTCVDHDLTYRLGETRAADDGCNACTCGPTGWSCTKFQCKGGAASVGTVKGKLAYPSRAVPSLQVCAEDGLKTVHFCKQTATGDETYALSLPEGRYYIYASLPDDPSKKAYYSDYVTCGLRAECPSHSPIAVDVANATPAAADPIDWYAAGSVDTVGITPSQYLDKTSFFMAGASFDLRGRGLARVEVFAVPASGDALLSLGSASSTIDQKGDGTWRIPIPDDLQAADVYAVATDVQGKTLRTPGTGRVRPRSTLQ